MKSENVENNDIKMAKKTSFIIIFLYCISVVLFYFLAGQQLIFRESRGNIEELIPNSASIEMQTGSLITQTFTNDIQILDKIIIDFGDYKRKNDGVVNVKLVDEAQNRILIDQNIEQSEIKEGTKTEFYLSEPSEENYGHKMSIIIQGISGESGSVITPLMNTKENEDSRKQLFFNNKEVQGTICFEVQGRDRIWFGMHYWKFVLAGFVLVMAYCGMLNYRVKNNKKVLLFNVIFSLSKYKFLINQMVSRDFKTKYKRSVLGIFWSFLNPLLQMLVQYIVFSNLFKQDIPYYHVYLIIGVVMFNFFSEACGMTLSSILGNAHLMTKVYVPKYIYPLVRVSSSAINLLIALIPLLLITLFSGIVFTKAIVLIIFALICLIIFSFGLGLVLATSMVFFRDTQFLWGVISMMWMYLTPIFYPISIIPDKLAIIIKSNPLYYYIDFIRMCIIDGVSPEPIAYFNCIFSAIIMLFIGSYIFKKNEDKFIFYL